MQTTDLVPVRMGAHHLNNCPGDIAGFAPEEAARLVGIGAATYIGKPPAAARVLVEPAAEAPQGAWQEEEHAEPPPPVAPPAAIPAAWRGTAPSRTVPPKK